MSDRLVNFYKLIKSEKTVNPNYDRHQLELPFRALICTASGNGKSNLILNILLELTDTIHKIVIVTKAEEPLYDLLKKRLKDQVEIHYLAEGGTMPTITKMPKGQNAICVFDDLVMDQTKEIAELYIRGRKLGYSSLFLSQSFYAVSKIVRQNCNYLWLGRGLMKRDLNLIVSEISIGLTKDELSSLYEQITAEPMTFMMIDLHKRNIRRNIVEIVRQM